MLRHLTPLRIALVIGVVLCALRFSAFSYLELFDARAMDYRLLQRGVQAPASEVVIVAIDDASLEKYGRWPWPRSLMARLVDRLTQADAAVIGFDIVQSEATTIPDLDQAINAIDGIDDKTRATVRRVLASSLTEDAALAAALKRSDRAVLGYFFDRERHATTLRDLPMTAYSAVRRTADGRGEQRIPMCTVATPNLPDLSAAARGLGFFNFLPDDDGLYRRAPLMIRYGDDIAMPLSLAMLRVYHPKETPSIRFKEFGVESARLGAREIPVAEDGQLLVNYRGPGRTFRHISAFEALDGTLAPGSLHDKLVLVGVTATAVADVRNTPFDGVMPGVEIHANVLDNILRDDFILQPKWLVLVEIALILLVVALLGLILQYARGVAGALVAIALLGGYVFASQWVFRSTGVVLSFVYPLLAISVTYAAISVQHYVVESRERRQTRKTLELYLSPELAGLIGDHPEMLKLGGEKSERTVLFSDIRGFTSISERLAPEALVDLLNSYLGAMTDVIFEHDGMLDKYIGDAIMAVWSAPLPQTDHAARACRAALDMLRRLRELEPQWLERGWPKLDIGIGLNTGPMVFGNMGSTQHLSLTVMGDEVNLGSRLEGLNKQYHSHIIISESTLRAAADTVTVRELDLVRVKGKVQPVRIFEVVGAADEQPQWEDVIRHSDAGVQAYRQQRWDDAEASFRAVLSSRPDDGAATLYLTRCQTMRAQPPGADWDGVTVMETK